MKATTESYIHGIEKVAARYADSIEKIAVLNRSRLPDDEHRTLHIVAQFLRTLAAAPRTPEVTPEDAQDTFCDAHCTWRDHHADCPRRV